MGKEIKNIGIFAHVDAGKTTLTEQLLYHTGAITNPGRVDHGNTVTDNLALERERGISIMSMPTSYNYKGQKINIIDTPGHVDFIAEVERSMSILDGAILVISAKEGVQSHTKLLFNALSRIGIPTLIFINKIDRMGVELKKVLNEIRMFLSEKIHLMQEVFEEGTRQAVVTEKNLIAKDELIDILSNIDETVISDYLEDMVISHERLENLFKTAVTEKEVYPVFLGSALNDIGVEGLLDGINNLLPLFKPLDTQDTSGIIFKVRRRHLKTGRECILKVTAGSIEKFSHIGEDKITNMSIWEHGKIYPVDVLYAGEIGIVTGLNHFSIGYEFGQPMNHKGISLGKPTLKSKIIPVNKSQRKQLLEALSLIMEGDPYLSYELNEFNDDIYINLFGYVQMEIVGEILMRDYCIEVHMEDPMTIYMETPNSTAEVMKHMYKDGLNFHAGVGIRIEPLERGSGVQYISEVGTGFLKTTYQNGVRDGVFSYIDQGLKGWELTDMKITLTDYEYNSVDSTPKDYRDLTPIALFEALKQVGTKLLWPINEYTLKIPITFMGKAISDLQRMKSTFCDPIVEGDFCTIKGNIPQELLDNYEIKVHEYTSGMGHFETRFSGYEQAPEDINRERPRFKVDPANRGKYLLSKLNTI